MLTITEICNRALDKLGVEPINSVETPTLINEKRFARIYPQVKRRELRKRRWRCAVKEASLSATEGKSGGSRPRYRFPLPNDCLRPLRDDATTWEVYGKMLFWDGSGPLDIEYVADISETLFDDALADVIICKLAEEMAEPVSQNANKKAQMQQDYKDAVREASRDNAFLIGDEDLRDSDAGFDWLGARY